MIVNKWSALMIRVVAFTCIALGTLCLPAVAHEPRDVFAIEIDSGIDEVWVAFTTTAGIQSWVAPLAEIDFKVGGKWRANYNSEGELGDSTTIENTILAYDPMRMIALKATTFPEGFAFVEAAKETWTVFYFSSVSKLRTKITVVGLGYTDSAESQKMLSFFDEANEYSLKELEKALRENNPQRGTQ